MKILVHCRTNLDDYQIESWPTEMCCRPLIGDRIQSKSGKVLKVYGVTHKSTNTPYLEIELNK